jgi:hypothetical protein
LPAAKRKKARCGKNRLHNASRTSRHASLLSSPTDDDRRSITAASMTDFDCFSSGAGWGRAGGWLRQHHRRLPADRHPTSTTPSSALYGPPSGSRLRPVAGLLFAWRLAGSDYTIFCTLRAAVRQPAPAGCRAAAPGGSPAPTPPLPALRQPAPAGCIVATRGEARWLRRQHPLHSTGRSPAIGFCRLQGCGARGGSLAPTTPSSALCGPPSGSRPRPGAGLRRVGRLAGSDDNILCTLRAAIRQPAPAGCRAAARGEARWLRLHHLLHSAGRRPAAGFGRLPSCSALGVPAPTTPCSVICEQLSCNRLRLAVGGCPPLHYMPSPQPSNRITPSHTCTIHLMGPTPTPVALSGESIHSPVGPLSFFLRP